MIPTDIQAVLQWWSVLLLLGIGLAPLTFLLFDRFFDKGYIFSKLIGLLLTGYLIFVLGVFHILPFTNTGILISFALLAVGMFFALPHKRNVFSV